eukprot:7041133-Heterocapsa_arctica.AAC.1
MEPGSTLAWLATGRPRSRSDNEWQSCSERRSRTIANIKATFPFSEARFKNRPSLMPDPNDRSLSKRSWEAQIMRLRNCFKTINLAELLFGGKA